MSQPKSRIPVTTVLAIFGLSVAAGCATNPATGQSQLALVSEGQEIAMGGAKAVNGGSQANRIRLARLTKDGVGNSTLIGRASGYQPPAGVIGGNKPGEWLVGWRDFEAGQHEGFIVRAECK